MTTSSKTRGALPWLTLAVLPALLVACGDGNTDSSDGSPDSTATSPGDVACEDNLCVVTGTITEDTTFTADKSWLLRGGVFIGDDVGRTDLTIEPGTTIYGENATGGMLVIRRGSRLLASGAADAPIVFTSSKEAGSRARGDWGGLILNGRAPINNCATAESGACEQFGEGGTGFFGGDDPDDDSGVLEYVRVEFAGTLISPDNELNGIGFQGVGRGTLVDHVQIHRNADDGIEFFGGTVDFKHVLVTGVGDDLLDWTDGWTGKGQYFVGQQYEDGGDNGIEGDNNAENNDALPRSHPTLANVTLVGSPASTFSDFGALLREGTAGDIHASVFTGFEQACLSMAQAATLDQVDAGELQLRTSLFDCAHPSLTDDLNGEITDADVASLLTQGAGNLEADAELVDPFAVASPDFRPDAGSAALSGGITPDNAFFEPVTFRGGVDPDDDWTTGWTTSAPN